ncbi:MAG: nuclear transport factor 2 (NTF2) superfamily protein [Planctomycetota bacterium]|jgi:nuclear transport factor 2 (NTF2) superfamily protein
MQPQPLVPPFSFESATAKVRLAEDAWNSRDPVRISEAYSLTSRWRNRSEFIEGRPAIQELLRAKWEKERDYRLVKSLWAHGDRRLAVRFEYEWRDDRDAWFRSYGNELWEFDDEGLMSWRQASINDVPIESENRRFHWDAPGPRPSGLLDLPSWESSLTS